MSIFHVRLLLTAALILCFAAVCLDKNHRINTLFAFRQRQIDFEVYYTAATMVRSHLGQYMYSDADTGVDPQLRLAKDGTIFGNEARALGINQVHLYVYPPTLADGLAPLTLLPIWSATVVWKCVNWAALLLLAWMLPGLLDLPRMTGRMALTLALLMIFRPDLECFFVGQVTVVLTCIEVGAMLLYVRGHKTVAGCLFSLGIMLKIMPLVVVVPFLMWRDWRVLRAIAVWCLFFIAVIYWMNGTELIPDYVQHVLPSMSHGVVEVSNKSLGSAVKIIWLSATHREAPQALAVLSKGFSALTLCYAGWLGSSARNGDLRESRVSCVSMFLLLAPCISPVSWPHAYVLAIPAVFVLTMEALWARLTNLHTVVLAGFVVSISGFWFDTRAIHAQSTLLFVVAMLTPFLGIALALMELGRIQRLAGDTGIRAHPNDGVSCHGA